MRRILWIVVATAAVLTGCDATGPSFLGNVQVSFATQGAGQQPLAAAALPAVAGFQDDTIASGADTIIVTSVEIVLREIELERPEGAGCSDALDGDDDACEELELGPVLISLPLDGSVATEIAVDVPPASYTEIEFEVHKVEGDDPEDEAFLAEHPDFEGLSIRVAGTFNGQPFAFETDLNVEQEIEFSPPLVITEESQTNVTILVALDEWFRAPNAALYDPATGNKGGENESEIKENITQSFEAFEDDDRDGER